MSMQGDVGLSLLERIESGEKSHKETSVGLNSAAILPPPITSVVGGIASSPQMSIFSAISMASSTSMPR